MNYIIYHKRDFDGQCSGAIAAYWHKQNNIEYTLLPFDYGEELPTLSDCNKIYMVDVTLQPAEKMIELNTSYNIFVIDHHKSWIESAEFNKIQGAGNIHKAACELTWEYFFPDIDTPEIVYLLGRYDIWDKSDLIFWNHDILPFQMGMRLKDVDIQHNLKFWEWFFQHSNDETILEIENIIKDGNIILQYQKQQDKKTIDLYSFESEISGYKAICLNNTRFNSMVYESVWDPEKYDVMFAWVNVQGKRISCSLYTDKPGIDVSTIAKQFGGGGHKQAAGFQCKDIQIRKQITIIKE